MVGRSELHTYFKFVYLYQKKMFIFRGLLIEIGEQLLSIFSFLKGHWISHQTSHQFCSHHFFNVARFLCVLKCFSKYIEPVYAYRMHCFLQILALHFIQIIWLWQKRTVWDQGCGNVSDQNIEIISKIWVLESYCTSED